MAQIPEFDVDRSLAGEAPLCVDLDGTLIRSDVLVESLAVLLKRRPLLLLWLPLWALRGRAYLKEQLGKRVEIDPSVLPYRDEVLEYLLAERRSGRTVVLATAAHTSIAHKVASELEIFDDVLATEAKENLSGQIKAERLAERFGVGGYDYIGDSRKDLPVWRLARRAILAGPNARTRRQAVRHRNVTHVFDVRAGAVESIWHALRALRPYQWVKNLLLFVPLVLAHRLFDPAAAGSAALAFAMFSLAASSTYLLNDLLDLEADRRHERKRNRPLASGRLSLLAGMGLVPVLLGCSLALTWWLLPAAFLGVLCIYVLLTLAYSFHFKQRVLIDVVLLGGLYTLRIIAGATAIAVPMSFWLLAFSLFFFFSLALLKRYSELLAVASNGGTKLHGRGYEPDDIPLLIGFGVASGYTAVLVLALYINSSAVRALYADPQILWLLCPVFLYWISRAWLLAHRGQMHDDPVLFAIKDKVSVGIAAVCALILLLAL